MTNEQQASGNWLLRKPFVTPLAVQSFLPAVGRRSEMAGGAILYEDLCVGEPNRCPDRCVQGSLDLCHMIGGRDASCAILFLGFEEPVQPIRADEAVD